MAKVLHHEAPDMTLTRAESDADHAAWKELEAENKRLRAALLDARCALSGAGYERQVDDIDKALATSASQ